jgi:nitrogen fixation NifU-like protein
MVNIDPKQRLNVYMSMRNLYEEEILDHYQNPRNFGLLEHADFLSPLYNPSCGDSITIAGKVEQGKIIQLLFSGKGCVLSLAMASMLTVFAQGKTLEEILSYNEDLVGQLLKTQLGMKRMQCGMLSVHALQNGIKLYLEKVV